MNKLSENVASVPVTGNSRKVEASAHLSKILLRWNQTTIISLDWLNRIRMLFRANSSPFSGL